MSKLRFKVVESAFEKKVTDVAAPAERPQNIMARMFSIGRKCLNTYPKKYMKS